MLQIIPRLIHTRSRTENTRYIKYSCVKCAYIIKNTACNNRFITWTWNGRYSSASDGVMADSACVRDVAPPYAFRLNWLPGTLRK